MHAMRRINKRMLRFPFLRVALGLTLAAVWSLAVAAAEPAVSRTDKAPSAKYIAVGEIALKELLPDPSADDSAATRAEIEELLKLQVSRTPEQIELAKAEDPLTVYAFAPVLGTNFTAARLPVTDKLLAQVGADTMAVSAGGKKLWNRARPFDTDARIQPSGRKPGSLSYPSGHATRAFAWAVVLGELFPAKKVELLERAREIGQSRLIAGVHYPSDVAAGTKLGQAIGAKVIVSAAFQEDADAARQEIESILTRK
jgi:acid phosphatase (class A)